MSNMVECPDEAHVLDNSFNPSSQGPYGPGYHDCDLCGGKGEITFEEYELWEQEQLVIRLKKKTKKVFSFAEDVAKQLTK